MADPELEAAGYREGCEDCRSAVRLGQEACPHHYVPTHVRTDPSECPSCGGRKDPDRDRCGRCRAAEID